MQTSNRHIINQLFFEVNTASKKTAYYLKDNLDTFLKEELFPLLETYFDTLGLKIPFQSLQIEKLNIDLSIASAVDFEIIKLEIISQFQKQIGKQIEKGFPDYKHYTLINNKEKNENEFFSFLETGITVWWAISKDISNLTEDHQFEKVISDKAFGTKLLNALKTPQTRNRFIKQLSDKQIYTVLKNTFHLEFTKETTSKNISRIKDNMNVVLSQPKHGLHQRNLIWDIVLSQLLKDNDTIINEKLWGLIASFDVIIKYNPKFVLEHLNTHIVNTAALDMLSNIANEVLMMQVILEQKTSEIFQKNSNKKSIESNFSKTDESLVSVNKKEAEINSVFNTNEANKKEDFLHSPLFLNEKTVPEIPANYYVNNAGLLLIHPFLKTLFENCRLLSKNNTINDPEVAAHLLHYIATEQEQDYEHAMLFEKLLCNIPINQTINRNIILSEELKNHANEMLRAVLDHWDVMKNSSLGLLRNEYLQRPGKIILTGENPKVLVERKTQDILLDKISWNLGIVKLAWKNKIIFVDW